MTHSLSEPAPEAKVDIGPICLVTGGAGYLGSHLIQRLLSIGYHVHSFDQKPCKIDDERVTSFIGDIRNYTDLSRACDGVDTVFHTVAIINLFSIYRRKERDLCFDINVSGTAQVLKAATDSGVKRFVYTSSNSVCFDREIIMGDESIPYATRPMDLYTETKAMAEKLVLDADNGRGGIRTASLRPGGIWGGSDAGMMLSGFIEQLALGRFKAIPGDGSAQVDNTHISNLVDAEILAAEKLASNADLVGGQAYYITDEEPMNGVEWFRPLVEALGEPWPWLHLPAGMMYAVGYFVDLLHYAGVPQLTLSRMSILKVTRSHTFKTDRARRELGYKPRVRRMDGLRELVPYARELISKRKNKSL